MASKTLADGRKVLVGSKADPDSVNFQPQNTAPLSSGTPDFSASINSSVLAPQKGFTIPPVAPATESVALQGTIQAQTDQFTKGLEQKAKAAEKSKTSSLDDLLSTLQSQEGQSSLTAQAEKEAGVDTLSVELSDINNQILQEQVALQRRVEKIEENKSGLFGGAMESEIERATRDSLRKQADLSVIAYAKNSQFETAKAIADRSVSVQLESQKKELDILSLIYSENKDLFTTSEKRLFETQQGDRERALNKQEKDLQTISDLSLNAMQNGAPASVARQMREAATVGEAMDIGGRYIDLLDRQLKQQQLSSSRTNQLLALASAGDPDAIKTLGFDPSSVVVETDPTTRRQQTDKIEATDRLIGLATQYKTIVDKYGYTNEIFGNSTVIGQINSLRSQMTAAYKSAETLGTLDRGVLDLMDQMLGAKPTSSIIGLGEEGNIFANTTGRRANKISASLDTFITEASKSKAQSQLRLGIDPTQDYLLNEEDNAEIDSYLNTSTFNAANYY